MKQIITYLILGITITNFIACKKVSERPPLTNILGHKVYSVTELNSIATCTNSCAKRFTQDVYFIGVVVGDSKSGNFYKELYVRDRYNTGGIHLDLTQSSNFWIGDSVRVNLKGLDVNLNSSTGMLEIDSLDWEKYIVKFATAAKPQPRMVTIAQLNSNLSSYLCDLIQINSVGFKTSHANQIWADNIAQSSLNRTLKDCSGDSLIVRTSNYADFASQTTPSGNGSIIGIATAYKGTPQMEIRDPAEFSMTGASCTIYFVDNFDDGNLFNGGWAAQSVSNSAVTWSASSFGSEKFAKITGFVSGNTNTENWLISPPINLSTAGNPVLSFQTAAKYAGDILEVHVSMNYNSGPPSTATWTQLNGFALSPNNPGNYVATASGNISLATFKNSNTRIAFKYKSSTSVGATTYELDNVLINEN